MHTSRVAALFSALTLGAMRFAQDGSALLVVRNDAVMVWLPGVARPVTLGTLQGPHAILGADLFADGVALWTTDAVAPR